MSAKYQVMIVDYDDDLYFPGDPVIEEMRTALKTVDAELSLFQYRTEQDAVQKGIDADILMIQSVRPVIGGNLIRTLKRCRGIVRMGLGYDSVDIPTATAAGLPVSNVINWCNDEVAEHAIALLMSAARKLPALDHPLRAGDWQRAVAAPVHRMRGATLGLVGFGRIAQAVAERMRGFGMNILAYDPFLPPSVFEKMGVTGVDLPTLLQRSDYVSLHARLTPETIHLISTQQLAMMKKGAFLINTSRGPMVDEPALINALQNGHLGGAALDVMEKEPMAVDSPLRKMENVVLTPHLSSYSVEAVQELYRFSADYAVNMLRGQWLPTFVNPEVRTAAEARTGKFIN